jgi:hypothetical protein
MLKQGEAVPPIELIYDADEHEQGNRPYDIYNGGTQIQGRITCWSQNKAAVIVQ